MFEKKHLSPSMVLTGIEAKNGSLDANSFAVYALSNQVVEQRNKRAFLGELKDTGLISNDTLEDYQWISFDALEHVLQQGAARARRGVGAHLLVIEHGQHWDVRELRTLLSKTLERPQSRMHRGQIIQAPDGKKRLVLPEHRSTGRVRQH